DRRRPPPDHDQPPDPRSEAEAGAGGHRDPQGPQGGRDRRDPRAARPPRPAHRPGRGSAAGFHDESAAGALRDRHDRHPRRGVGVPDPGHRLDHRVDPRGPAPDPAGPAERRQGRAPRGAEGRWRRVHRAHGAAGRGHLAKAPGGGPRGGAGDLREDPPLGAHRGPLPQVHRPGDLRDRPDLLGVRPALRAATLGGHRAALPLRRLPGAAPHHPPGSEVAWPKPLEEDLEAALEIYAKTRPWVRIEDLSPKSIVREIYETGQTFSEFVQRYGLQRSEGIVLRYLSDAYRALRRTIPQDLRTEQLDDLIEWLGVLVRGIDSSLLDEWEALSHPEDAEADGAAEIRPTTPRGLSAQTKVLRTMVRAAMWQRVEHFAFEREQRLAELDGASGWDRSRWAQAMDEYYDAYDDVGIDGPARSPQLLQITEESRIWRIRQVLADPVGNHDWAIEAELDVEATDEAGEPVLAITHVGDIADR